MSAGQQQQDQSGSLDYLWGAAILVLTILLIWWVGKTYIIHFIFTIKLAELSVINLFSQHARDVTSWIHENYNNAHNLDYPTVNAVLYEAGKFIRIPCALLLFGSAAYLFFFSPSTKFNTTFSMKTLRNSQLEDWPFITPIANLDLLKENVHKGPWAMTRSPMEFAKKNGLIIPPPKPKRGEQRQLTATIDTEKAKAVFAKQLGPQLESVENIPIYVKALLGVFSARIHEVRDAPVELLENIAASAQTGKLDFTGAKALYDRFKKESAFTEIFSRHGYLTTFAASMLEAARMDGVVASADFLWLKPVDRTMWYMLNNVGRQTAFSEVAGPFAHWQAEKKLGRRINQPMVDEATTALKEAISHIIYTDE